MHCTMNVTVVHLVVKNVLKKIQALDKGFMYKSIFVPLNYRTEEEEAAKSA